MLCVMFRFSRYIVIRFLNPQISELVLVLKILYRSGSRSHYKTHCEKIKIQRWARTEMCCQDGWRGRRWRRSSRKWIYSHVVCVQWQKVNSNGHHKFSGRGFVHIYENGRQVQGLKTKNKTPPLLLYFTSLTTRASILPNAPLNHLFPKRLFNLPVRHPIGCSNITNGWYFLFNPLPSLASRYGTSEKSSTSKARRCLRQDQNLVKEVFYSLHL